MNKKIKILTWMILSNWFCSFSLDSVNFFVPFILNNKNGYLNQHFFLFGSFSFFYFLIGSLNFLVILLVIVFFCLDCWWNWIHSLTSPSSSYPGLGPAVAEFRSILYSSIGTGIRSQQSRPIVAILEPPNQAS